MSQSTRNPASVANLEATDLLARLPGPSGERFVEGFRHGSLTVELYAPRGCDPQHPHTRDEAYVVAQGHGLFWDGTSRRPFGPGTFLFARAGQPHRFEEFTDDLAVWVLFYGPEGGELGPSRPDAPGTEDNQQEDR
jgi:mannose-6-phosphate isomerase-like protein (cupin superfamily)